MEGKFKVGDTAYWGDIGTIKIYEVFIKGTKEDNRFLVGNELFEASVGQNKLFHSRLEAEKFLSRIKEEHYLRIQSHKDLD